MNATDQNMSTKNPEGKPLTLLAFGDSLTAGYGLPAGASFTSLIEKRLNNEGYNIRIVNAGVSGDTSAGGLARLDWALAENPDLAWVELGANDVLQGLDPSKMEANLDAILAKLGERGVPTLLIGMYAPVNMGPEYATHFNAVFPRLAMRRKTPLFPFLLEDVAQKQELNLPDGIHPNAEGSKIIADNLYPSVKRLIDKHLEARD